MLDFGAGAYPVFFDIDRDGLTDLLIGNYGYYDTSYYDQFMILHTEQTGKIAYLRNTGTAAHPAFTFMDRDFGGVSGLGLKGLVPAFGDLDGDNDADMLLGCEDGTIISYLNTANQGEPMNLVLSQLNFQGIDVGSFSTPQLFDLDHDDKADLIIGEKGGNLNYYRNTGTLQQPSFTLETDSLGKINVTDYSVSLDGYSVPCFYRDALERTHLLVGSEQGDIFYYTGIDGNLEGEFTKSDTLAGLIGLQEFEQDRGYRSAPALSDLNQDGHPELITGNFSGGLEYFAGSDFPPVSGFSENNLSVPCVTVFPVPSSGQINIIVPETGSWRIIGLKIISADGRVIFDDDYNNEIKITVDTTFMIKGLFIYQIKMIDKGNGRVYYYNSKAVKVF
jgi:hypothetical protein